MYCKKRATGPLKSVEVSLSIVAVSKLLDSEQTFEDSSLGRVTLMKQ